MFNYRHPVAPSIHVAALLAALKYAAALKLGMTKNQRIDLMKEICHNDNALIFEACIILLASVKAQSDAH